MYNMGREKVNIEYTEPLINVAFPNSEGREICRWSHNKFFTQVIKTIELEPNTCIFTHELINDTIPYRYVEIISIARLNLISIHVG